MIDPIHAKYAEIEGGEYANKELESEGANHARV
jgi:hypothetical protein